MHVYQRTIHLADTDATGVLYFSEQLKLGLEALESFFLSKGFTLQHMIEKEDFFMPIVHAEADFKKPIFVGDQVEVHLFLDEVGTSSFSLKTKIIKKEEEMGSTRIIHVAVSKKDYASILLPDRVLSHLREL